MNIKEAYILGYDAALNEKPSAPIYHLDKELWNKENFMDLCKSFSNGYNTKVIEEIMKIDKED